MKKEIRLCMACVMLALIFLLGGKKANAQEVPINAETFPSDWLRNLMLTPEYDLNGNGILSDEEIQKITSIKYVFPADTGRFDLFKAEGLVNLPYCTYLELTNLMCLNCEITFYTELPSTIQLWYCQISHLQVSGQNVQTICCDKRGYYFEWEGVPASAAAIVSYVKSIDTTACPNLRTLAIEGGSARTLGWYLDLSQNSKLEYLSCERGEIAELRLSNNKNLKYLRCRGNSLIRLDLSAQKKLELLDCANCSLEELDVSKCVKLKHLNCSKNYLKLLNLQKNTQLEDVQCYQNYLKSLNLGKNKKLKSLQCFENCLKSLDLKRNTNLEWILCYDNHIRKLSLPASGLVHDSGYEGYSYGGYDYYPEGDDLIQSSFACNPIQTLDITSVKQFAGKDWHKFAARDLSRFISGDFYKREVREDVFRGKSRPIKKLIVNKKLRKKDMEKVRKQAKKYKVKLVY